MICTKIYVLSLLDQIFVEINSLIIYTGAFYVCKIQVPVTSYLMTPVIVSALLVHPILPLVQVRIYQFHFLQKGSCLHAFKPAGGTFICIIAIKNCL